MEREGVAAPGLNVSSASIVQYTGNDRKTYFRPVKSFSLQGPVLAVPLPVGVSPIETKEL